MYSNDDIFVGTHEASLDATLVGPCSFIPNSDSSTGEGLLFMGETRRISQYHADGTRSEDHLAELMR